MKLKYVSYISNQSQILREEDIQDLLYKVREKNRKLAITGLLLLIQGKFIQYIEGPEDEIISVYESIKNDTRHNSLLLLDIGDLKERQFKDWSMSYKKINNDELEKETGYKDLDLNELLQKPYSKKKHPILNILYKFLSRLSK
ncbi:MAG: BLUF domain-containing protein [Bacteroidota bacterium]